MKIIDASDLWFIELFRKILQTLCIFLFPKMEGNIQVNIEFFPDEDNYTKYLGEIAINKLEWTTREGNDRFWVDSMPCPCFDDGGNITIYIKK